MDSNFTRAILVAVLCALVFSVALVRRSDILNPMDTTTALSATTTTPAKRSLRAIEDDRKLKQTFDTLVLDGKAVVVWNATDKSMLYERSAEIQLPLASLSKVMLAYTASQLFDRDAEIAVAPSDLKEDGASGLSLGERFAFSRLLDATLIASLNDAATAIARSGGTRLTQTLVVGEQKTAFVTRMNAEAKRLGMMQTYFLNENGLDVGRGQAGAMGSAKDMAILMDAFLKYFPGTLKGTIKGAYDLVGSNGMSHRYYNTNQHLDDYPGISASKTGYTDLAGGNLVLAADIFGKSMVFVVLGSTKEGRFTDTKQLFDLTRKTFSSTSTAP